MSYPPRSTGLISIFKNISRHRLLVITALMMLGVAGAAISRSFAFKANFSRGAEPKISSAAESRSGVRSKESIALLRFAGLRGAAAPLSPRSVLAPTVTATKIDTLFTDVDLDLMADPGDTLKYTVTINASGEDATGVTFTDTVDPNTAIVPGTLTATPVAVNDSYSALGNVRISVPAPGVRGNDFDGVGVPAATASAPATSANGGNVAMNADGSFTYNPPAGFEGADTFTYTLTNGAGSNPGTVTINVSGMIWFINNNASCPCDGRLTNPFNTLASFEAVNDGVGNNPAVNDNIFLYESAIDYFGPVTLLNGQRFLGQDSTASLSAMTGLTPPTFSDPLPATDGGNAIIVNITSASNSINVGSGNTLRGFTGGNSASDINGTGFGTLTISDVTLNGTGQALDLTTGTLAASFISISSTNSSTTGVSLTSVAGSLTSPSTSVTNPAGIGVSVGTSTGTLNFGNTTSTGSGGIGVSLLTNSGAITFGALNISPDANQRGLLATDNSNTITSTSGAISTSGATAVEITRAVGTTPLAIAQTSVSANGGTNGIMLSNTNGSFTVAGSGGSCSTSVNCTGGAILNTTNAVLLSNASNVSIDRMFIQNTIDSGIKGTSSCTDFTFTNGVIDNSGTGGGLQTSNIGFNAQAMGTENNLSGTVTITGNTLTNARYHGVSIFNFAGTISDLDISNNTLTSSALVANSIGHAIQVVAFGSAGTVASLTKGTIDANKINNFPSAVGINLQCGNANNAAAPSSSCGTAGSGTNIINITNNEINKPGNGSTVKTGGEGIIALVNGVGQGNFNISSNNVQQNAGTSISSSAFGNANVTETINSNIIVSNNTVTSPGIGVGTSITGGFATNSPHLTVSINSNNVSQTDGNGIFAVARDSQSGLLDVTIKNNTVAAPLTGIRPGIRIDAGNAAGDNDVCLDISSNTSDGSGNPATTKQPGIGLRKQGTSPTVNAFGIEGMSATASPGVQNFVNAANPGSAPGGPTSGAVGGTVLLSATSGFSNCSSAPLLLASEATDVLYATHGKGPGGDDIRELTQAELSATVYAAIERWREAGISSEDLMRLQAVRFEIADLPEDQLAVAISTSVRIDETAADYGWYFDLAPMEDSEFDVAVPNRELQTSEYSSAFRRMDLLTVVMRELGHVYRQGKKRVISSELRPLMESTLAPAVRRLPNSRNIQLPRSPGRASAKYQLDGEKHIGAKSSKPSALRRNTTVSPSAVSYSSTGLNPIAKTLSRQSSRRMNHAAVNRKTVAALNSMLADVMLNIGTLPAGESVTITFNVTVDNPFTGALPQVSNQGTVSGSNFADVLTDDPDVGGTADPTVTPIDLPSVTVAVSPSSVLEDGLTNLTYTFTRSGSTANAMTVNFSVGGTASFTEPDYTQTGAATFTATSGTIVIPSGSSSATVTVDPSLDLTVEGDETIVLTVASGVGYTVGSPSAAPGTITNDDTSVSVAVSPGSVAEDGVPNLVYTFTRTGVLSTPLAVDFTVGGTADFGASPNDYTQTGATAFTSAAGVVTFAAMSSTATVTINPETDSTVEADETVILTVIAGVGYTAGTPASATGTITNDDTDVTLAVSPSSVVEDGLPNLVYTFTRNGATSSALTVNFTVGGTADFGASPNDYTQTGAASYSASSGTVTFAAMSSTATVIVNPETDSTVEGDETVILTLASGTGYNVATPGPVTGTITNDDTDVTLAVSPASVAEDGMPNLVYTFTRNGVTSTALTVNFLVSGSASFPGDYTQSGAATFSSSSGTVTFAAMSSTATVTIDPVTDSTVEADETVELTLDAGAGYNVGTPGTITGTITNDDTDVTLAVSPSSVAEDGGINLTYTFTRNGVTSNALTVNFSVAGSASFPGDYSQSGADTYSSSAGTVIFAANATTATVIIDPVTDTTIEADETVILTLASGAGYNVSTPSSAEGTITNDDADVSVAVAPASVAEDGATNLVYTFTRTGFTAGALTVNFSVGGTAVFSEPDYTQTGAATFGDTSGTVIFASGNSTAIVTVDPSTDTTAEPDETVVITLMGGPSYNAVSPNSATGTILNDDTLVSVVVSPTSTAEGGASLVYTFTRTGPTTSALTVNFSVGGSASFPADYSQSGATTFTPPTATVTFGVGSSTATVTVTPLTDCTVEGNETVDFTVQPGTGYGVGSPSTASGTITNTPDSSAPTITLIPNVNMTLWPPNHQYEDIAVTDFVASASDNCDPSVNVNSVYIVKITSDEAENGNGDGNTMNDIIIGASCKTAQLRSERSGNGNGRVYSITFKVKDSAGNFATATTTVTVRKSPNQPAVDSGTQYTVNSVCP